MTGKIKLNIEIKHNSDFMANYAAIEDRIQWERYLKQKVTNAFDLSVYDVNVKILFEG